LKYTEFTCEPECRIIFPEDRLQILFNHCRRKLSEQFIQDETRERKAFGLIAGTKNDLTFTVEKCLPLIKNVRAQEPYNEFMDQVIAQHAIPSETPLSHRGWIAEPAELLGKIKQIQQNSLLLLGTYHMHRVAWPDDPLRDTPTTLDTVLAADSSMLLFIISMINPAEPIIRAFYEGNLEREIPIIT
jgi:hypothetical protein